MVKLILHTKDQKSTILIGKDILSKIHQLPYHNLFLLIDEKVNILHHEKFSSFNKLIIPRGEINKNLGTVENVGRQLIERGADRSSFIIGIGGGLACDIAGFTASVYMRGVPFGFIATTLLAQVDASIGGKNGVNLDGYKNMIGVIRQPDFIWCDTTLLSTLPQKEWLSGLSEIVKYGAIRQKSLFQYMERNTHLLKDQNSEIIEHLVSESARTKVAIVESDEQENGIRKLLNFGHTLGHAIERLSGLLHGEAVSIGMVLAARLSFNMGYLNIDEADRLESLLNHIGLPVTTSIDHNQLFETLQKDKKRQGEEMHFILLKGIGDAFIKKIKLPDLKSSIYDLY